MRNISQDLRNNKNQAAGVSMERGVRRPEDIGIGAGRSTPCGKGS